MHYMLACQAWQIRRVDMRHGNTITWSERPSGFPCVYRPCTVLNLAMGPNGSSSMLVKHLHCLQQASSFSHCGCTRGDFGPRGGRGYPPWDHAGGRRGGRWREPPGRGFIDRSEPLPPDERYHPDEDDRYQPPDVGDEPSEAGVASQASPSAF